MKSQSHQDLSKHQPGGESKTRGEPKAKDEAEARNEPKSTDESKARDESKPRDGSKVHIDHAPHMTILGSAVRQEVAQLAQQGLIDEFQMVVVPVALGSGKTMCEGIKQRLELKLLGARTFKNGDGVLRYEPAK